MLSPRSQRTNENKGRRKFSFLRFLFGLIFMAFLGVVGYALFFSDFLEIASVDVTGNKYVEKDLILEKISPEISGKYLNIIKKNNLLLVRTGKIKKNILNDFKLIKKVEIRREFPSKISFQIIERNPQLVFCSVGKCFILDENGEAFDSYDFSQKIEKNNWIILTEEKQREIILGGIILEKNYMEYILGIKNKMSQLVEIEIEDNFKTPSLISKDIRVKTMEGWEIYFNQDIALEKEVSALKAILDKKIEKNQRTDLEYIDLRIDNKIFYKFKDGTPSQIAKEKSEEVQASSPK